MRIFQAFVLSVLVLLPGSLMAGMTGTPAPNFPRAAGSKVPHTSQESTHGRQNDGSLTNRHKDADSSWLPDDTRGDLVQRVTKANIHSKGYAFSDDNDETSAMHGYVWGMEKCSWSVDAPPGAIAKITVSNTIKFQGKWTIDMGMDNKINVLNEATDIHGTTHQYDVIVQCVGESDSTVESGAEVSVGGEAGFEAAAKSEPGEGESSKTEVAAKASKALSAGGKLYWKSVGETSSHQGDADSDTVSFDVPSIDAR